MRAIILAPLIGSNVQLPEDFKGGFTGVGNFPTEGCKTCLILIDTSPGTLDEMLLSGDYLLVEEVDPIAHVAPAHGVRRGIQEVHQISDNEYSRAWR